MNNLKFSVITPTHDPDNIPFLLETFESLCEQTHVNWEWILFINNKFLPQLVPKIIKEHPKVNIYHAYIDTPNLGAIKKAAFSLGTGDVLVELDHDDMLVPDCLEKLNIAYQNDEIGFVYSDCAVLHMKDEFIPYDSAHGWTHGSFTWKGKKLTAMNSFAPSSQSLSYIWYAPDHIRTWRKTHYDEIGGHNPDMFVCEDHELCIRSYLTTKMHFIPEPLYIYRITGNNTSIDKRNSEIQQKTKELHAQYAQKLAEKDAKDRNLLCVDIGGGLNPYANYMSIDLRKDADIVHDLNDGIPLPDNTVGVLNASHILEHLHDKNKIMAEIHRVLAPGGWAFIQVPSTDGRGAFQDPTHVSYWNENCFLYYTDAYLANFIDNKSIRFQEYRRQTYFPNEWLKNMNVCVTDAWLVAIKDGMPRLPGPLKI
jgi:glycosyltransferase involved in cell wall biosynthesis